MTSTGLIEINTGCSDISFKSCYSELYIDDKFVGYTPIQLFLPVGDHNYKIIKPGYFPPPPPPPLMAGVAHVQYGLKYSLDVALINSLVTGGLSITSSPEGANISIDGNDQKVITPTVISGITEGEHRYKLTVPGYTDIDSEFTMFLGQSTSIYNILTQSKESGTLYIYPTPVLYGRIFPYPLEGAKIYIDNVDTGKKIPSPITGLTKGIHTFRMTRPGVEDREGAFIINGGDVLLISIYPLLKPKMGIMAIHAFPPIGDIKNAGVYIDGKDTDEHANLRFVLPEGSHTYRLTLPDHEDSEGKFDIVQGIITMVTVYMSHIGVPSLGRLNISSDPCGAIVYIDDVGMGQHTPTTVRNLSDGDYTYRLSKSGYLDTTGTFTISGANSIDLHPMLIQTDTILDITSNVIASMVYIDSHTEGWTTPAEIIGLSPGTHTYTLVIPDTYGGGFTSANGTFNIEKNKRTLVYGKLDFTNVENRGTLIVNSVPIDAKVFIDDVDTGSTAPDTILGTSLGIHKVRLSLAGYKDWIGTVHVISGSIVSIFEILTPEKV
jgi:PEGA domain